MKFTPPNLDIWSSAVHPDIGTGNLSDEEVTLLNRLRSLRKAELHIHVEGSVHPDDIRALALKHGVPYAPSTRAFVNGDYERFFTAWFSTIELIRAPDDFRFIARGFVRRLREAGVVWCEAFVSPPDFEMRPSWKVPFDTVLREWVEGFRGSREPDVEVRLIVDLVRLYPNASAERWLDSLLRIREIEGGEIILGIGLGGPENARPLREYSEVLRRARREGLVCVVHAGERGSADDVNEAVFDVEADRIGHGIGLQNNERAYREVVSRRIPIEACPTSNIRLGCVDRYEDHPVKDWFADGALVTINTDDPSILETELCLEYLHLRRAFGWDEKDFLRLLANGVTASRMPEVQKANLLRSYDTRPSAQ